MDLHLISHHLCPYVQRAAITLAEKQVAFRRTDVDLAAKPGWFLAISPLGKTPVLVAEGTAIFESAVILEYLEETQPTSLHPRDPLARARHRGWIEFASAILNDIAGLYGAPERAAYETKLAALDTKFRRVESELGDGPYFAGADFRLVDAAFAPVFRYFDAFETIEGFALLDGLSRTERWRRALAARASVRGAVAADYPERLRSFLLARRSHLSTLMAPVTSAA